MLCCLAGIAAASSWAMAASLAGVRRWFGGALVAGLLVAGLAVAVDHSASAGDGRPSICTGVSS